MPRTDRRRELLKGLAFASPFLIGFVVFIAYPILASFRYSFTDFNLFQEPTAVGLDNYAHMLSDDRFWRSLGNTLYLTALGVPLTIVIALAGAHVLNLPVRGQPLFRALVYLPTIVPVVVGGYLWRWLLNAQYGFVNHLLELLRLPAPLWLESPDWSRPAIVLMSLWTVGGTTIIYLAGLKEIPKDLHEAAAIDGAGAWRRFRHITWPTLSPITLFQVIVTLIGFLQIFTQPYLLTQTRLNESSGGPDDSMLSYSMYLFQNAFVFLKMGYASAMAWVMFLITLVITALLLASSRRWVHYGSR
ncbi:sugar ABC transporter permease [Nonomuraea pusilla]|uniref:carbohydrate ABC transporter permease n=1 Tax=Nonomuraea pusilla TaxID=46177 RepID=UPI0033258F30